MKKINVDIYYTIAKSVMVEAEDKAHAMRIVEEKLDKNEIDIDMFSCTGEYELNTDWQPSDSLTEGELDEYFKQHKI